MERTFVLMCFCCVTSSIGLRLDVEYQWNFLDFDFPFDVDYRDVRYEMIISQIVK